MINKMRLLPPLASALVAQVYNNNLSVSLFISQKDYTGMIPIIAIYEDSLMFDKVINEIRAKLETYE